VDVVNDPYRPRSAVRHVTVNLLRVQRTRGVYHIGDTANGAYLRDVRTATLRYEPGENIPLRLADLFKLLKIPEDMADVRLQMDRGSWALVQDALRTGLLLSSDPTSTFQATLPNFLQNDLCRALLGNFLSVLMRSKKPKGLIERLGRLVTPSGDLVTILDRVIDVRSAAARVQDAHGSGWKLNFSDFDDLYRSSIATHPLATAFSTESLANYLASAFADRIGRPLDTRELAGFRQFYEEELLPWVIKYEHESAPFRIAAGERILRLLVNAMLSSQPQVTPILQLASIISKEFAGHLQRNLEAILAAVRAGQYRHLLQYYADRSLGLIRSQA
jgi:hypothetical protein